MMIYESMIIVSYLGWSILSYTKEDYGNGLETVLDYFAAFNNYEESFEARSQLLKNNYSQFVKENTIDGWIDALIIGGYATNRDYKKNLLSIIASWRLRG